MSKSWISHWTRKVQFFAFPQDIRKAIHTTKAIESMKIKLHKVLRNHRTQLTEDLRKLMQTKAPLLTDSHRFLTIP